MKDRGISLLTKARLVKALVFPVVLYGVESWVMTKADWRKINIFELWCWRRMLQISWTKKRTNASVIEQMTEAIGPIVTLEAMVCHRRLMFFGHIMSKDGSLEKDLMMGKLEGSRRHGRPRTRWVDGVVEAAGAGLGELARMVWN